MVTDLRDQKLLLQLERVNGLQCEMSQGVVRGEPNATETPAAAADARIYRFWANKLLNKAGMIIESDTDLRSDGAT